MRNQDRIRRSNRILIAIVILFLLYGIVYRMQTGDNKLYLFGYTIELPFGGQQNSEETTAGEQSEAAQDAAAEDASAK